VAGVGTSVADAVQAYRELLQDYARVVIVGDSAGGYLSGKVIEHAHAHGLPKPVAYVGYSPLLDLDLASNPASTSRHDAYLPKGKLAKLAPKFDRGPVEFTGERRVISVPVEAFPPTLLITAQDEFLEPDALELAEKLTTAGVVAKVHSYSWQLHAFPAIAVSRDTAEAVVLSADFVREALSAVEQGPATEQAG
jgi:acetyl esterase/lipase